jgi:outer membrane receptor protein involved in Fe transport
MNSRLRKLLPVLVFLCFTSSLFAQTRTQIRGKVVNAQEQPIEFATIYLWDAKDDQKKGGAITDAGGEFQLSTGIQDFYVSIQFMGFQTQTFRDIELVNGKADLGTIVLQPEDVKLDEVVIATEKSRTEFKLDKRIFRVGSDLSSTGSSALEVLNNVPSVNVDIEGAISLRGSQGVQILINGKPSVLASEEGNALGSITADMIESVEVITNPSAKYEAEGTSGIINIVLKKNERKGLNGSLTLNTGLPHNHSFGLSLSKRTEKLNLFTQLGAGYRELPRFRENINRDLVNNTTLLSDGIEYRNENYYQVIVGADYYLNPLNVITLTGRFALELEDQPSFTNFSLLDASDTPINEWYREETTEAVNPKYRYELNYKRDFTDHEDHDLVFSALGDFFGKDQSSEFFTTATKGVSPNGDQQTRTNFQESVFTFKLDYTRPFLEKFTLETGSQYVIQDVGNDFAVSELIDGEWIQDPSQTNVFEFNQKVLGVYSTTAYEGSKWGLKLGLRVENTDLQTLLVNTNEENDRNYTNFFPTFHSSYKFNEFFSVQAGYSRRIFRPRLWDLNPFFNIRNNFSIRTGNPNLMPEFTDSYEVTSILLLKKASLNLGVFHRYTTDVVERISRFEEGVSIVQPLNIGTNRATGIEFNGKFTPTKKITLNGDFNFLFFNRQGEFNQRNFDFTASQWTTKLNLKVKLPADIDAEVTGHYQSRYQTVQGERADNLFADLGVRKKFMKGKAVLNFSVRDIFASRVREITTSQPEFFLYSRRQRGRFLTLSFSYSIGKGEAMQFAGK